MTDLKSRNAILEKISKIRKFSISLGNLEDILKDEDKGISEITKDEIEKSA